MMTEGELIGLMQSDMKLWEHADTEDLGGGKVVKTIELPFGIGEVSVNLEGLSDAGKRRGAVASYGEYIRGLVDEKIDDDAITSRAQQDAEVARGRADRLHDEDGASAGGPAPVPDAKAVQPHGEVFIPTGETILVRLEELQQRIRVAETEATTCRVEYKALTAFKEVLDGQEMVDTEEAKASDAKS